MIRQHVGISDLKTNHTVQIVAEAETESIELVLKDTRKKVKETLDNVKKLQKESVDSRKKAERNAWIRMLLGALIGFVLGRASTLIGF